MTAGPQSDRDHAAGLARNTAVMAAGTLLSRMTGFGRLFALAYALGFTRLTDTYNLANVTPNIVYELVLGGVLSATLVPVFVSRLSTEEDEDDAWRAISAVVTAAGAVLVVVSLLFLVLAPLLIRLYTAGNDGASADEQRAVATTLLRMFAPQVAFYGMVTVTTALLQTRRRFAVPMFAPVLNNLVVIAVLLALPHVADEVSLSGVGGDTSALVLLGIGTTAGVAAMALVQLPALWRAGVRLRFVWDPRHEAVRTVLRLSGWTFGLVAANQVALAIVLILANGRAGDVAAYQAGLVFFLLPYGVFAVSVMSAMLPDMSQRWSRGDVQGLRQRVDLGLRTIAAVLVPAAVGYVCLARPIVRVVLDHGALRASSAETTAEVLALLALGLPAYASYLFLMRTYQAMQDTRSMFLLYLLENTLNVALAFALYPALGVQGLALAYALAYVGGSVAALAHLHARTGGIATAAAGRAWLRIGGASAVMAGAVLLAAALVAPAAAKVGAGIVAGVTVYLVVAKILGVQELSMLLRTRRPPA
ncbi:MAG: murein biosynthesis integral membrane protein MurJ [Actinomycetota bacterium]|nr:murein biosynthesis integral membrane protein MurJ [Actinomycetota bacterium]PLS76572.1 MAG: murein biosynthesis integral membrane protein MurJ [Actinomycetota bacterium]